METPILDQMITAQVKRDSLIDLINYKLNNTEWVEVPSPLGDLDQVQKETDLTYFSFQQAYGHHFITLRYGWNELVVYCPEKRVYWTRLDVVDKLDSMGILNFLLKDF